MCKPLYYGIKNKDLQIVEHYIISLLWCKRYELFFHDLYHRFRIIYPNQINS